MILFIFSICEGNKIPMQYNKLYATLDVYAHSSGEGIPEIYLA